MLDGTTTEIKERSALRINPAKTCQPIGAMYASLGIHGCMPHSHGSQGCCSYHRSHLTRHLKEPVIATTSSFTEGSSVFGGLSNLTQALQNIFSAYDPEVVAVHTTCLSEVIGDDIPMMIKKSVEEGKIPNGKLVIHANTPSFVGSHVTGFANMVTAMVKYIAESSGETKNQVNIIPGYTDPADMREIKRLASLMKVNSITFPDTTDVLDTPQTGVYEMYPKGGVTVEQMKTTGSSISTLALGHFASAPAAIALEDKCNVPAESLELPIGVTATDEYIDQLRQFSPNGEVPDEITRERGSLLDVISDMSQYFFQKRVAVFGDPDHVISLVRFLVELDMKPVYVITGSQGNHFENRVKEILKDQCPDAQVKQAADLFELHQWIKNAPVDLLIGNTYGKFMARAEGIPFVRFGFPVLDRITHRCFPVVGYSGAIRLIDKMIDAMFDKKDRECPEELTELVM